MIMAQQQLISVTLLSLLAACGGSGSSDNNDTSSFSLQVSDAPVDSVQKVCIAIAGLQLNDSNDKPLASWSPLDLLPTSNDDDCLPTGYSIPTDGDGHPRFLYLDLLHSQSGDSFALLSNQSISAGDYQQLRLQVEDGRSEALDGPASHPSSYVLDDAGNTLPLEVPSSELKLHGFNAPADGVASFQLEFNLRHAMVLPGHGNYYKLKPNGVSLLEVATLTTLQGQVSANLCDGNLDHAGVYLYPARNGSDLPYLGLNSDAASGGPVLTSLLQPATDTTPASYRLDYVSAGSYDLQLVCNASEDEVADSGSSDFIPTIGSSQLGISVDPAVENPQTIDLTDAPLL
jgi:hypothetical protein